MRSWGSLTFQITQNSGPPLLPICTFSKKLGARCWRWWSTYQLHCPSWGDCPRSGCSRLHQEGGRTHLARLAVTPRLRDRGRWRHQRGSRLATSQALPSWPRLADVSAAVFGPGIVFKCFQVGEQVKNNLCKESALTVSFSFDVTLLFVFYSRRKLTFQFTMESRHLWTDPSIRDQIFCILCLRCYNIVVDICMRCN